MQLWIDNTGLHAAGQCLSHSAETDFDLRGLLQLATLLIYADNLQVNGFEHHTVASRSKQIRNELVSLGLDSSTLEIKEVTQEAYALGCQTAAKDAASELPVSFHPDEHEIVCCEPPDLPRGIEERHVGFVQLATVTDESPALANVRASALNDKAVGAVDYMLAVCPELRKAVARIMHDHGKWSPRHSYQLNVFLRYYLNEALADQGFACYAPAVGRAKLIERQNAFVLQSLQDATDSVVKEFRGMPLGVPSLTAALVQRSKGDPTGVLAEAIDMRWKAAHLRRWLREHVDGLREDTPEGKFEIRQQIRELAEQLRKDLKLKPAPRFIDALEVVCVVGIPVSSISGAKLLEWLRHRLASRRTAVLTDIVKATAYSGNYSENYTKLLQSCIGTSTDAP